MKCYQQKVNPNDMPAQSNIPVWPEFAQGEPVLGVTVYRFFDRDGNFQGWCDYETGRKFLLGKLYYKTKGAYRTKKRSMRRANSDRTHIYEKQTGLLAAFAICRAITEEDLIDKDDREMLCKTTREQIERYEFNVWNFTAYPNKYKMIPESFQTKIQKDMQNFLFNMKKELLNYLDTQIVDVQQAKQLQAANIQATGGDWTPEGLV